MKLIPIKSINDVQEKDILLLISKESGIPRYLVDVGTPINTNDFIYCNEFNLWMGRNYNRPFAKVSQLFEMNYYEFYKLEKR